MSSLFGKAPKPEAPVRMPVPDDTAALAAADRQRKAIATRSGRASTVMSRRSGNGEAGTSSYSNSLLGSAG